MRMYDSTSEIWAYDSEDYSQFVDECDPIPGFDSVDEFTKIPVKAHKMASLVRMSLEFVRDSTFDVEKHLTKRMARSFARTEDRAFVNGTGVGEPTGLLHDTEGAETASTVDSVTYDDCIDLFFSVKPEYRANSVWMMNDRTALALRKLKDDDGNYLWKNEKDSILGKSVVICNEMPDADGGCKAGFWKNLVIGGYKNVAAWYEMDQTAIKPCETLGGKTWFLHLLAVDVEKEGMIGLN